MILARMVTHGSYQWHLQPPALRITPHVSYSVFSDTDMWVFLDVRVKIPWIRLVMRR